MLFTDNVKKIKNAAKKSGDFDGTYKYGFLWSYRNMYDLFKNTFMSTTEYSIWKAHLHWVKAKISFDLSTTQYAWHIELAIPIWYRRLIYIKMKAKAMSLPLGL